MRDVLFTDEVCQTITALLRGCYHQRRTRSQSNHNLRHRGVKAHRRKLQDAGVRGDRKPINLGGGKRAEPSMGDGDALGRSGRA